MLGLGKLARLRILRLGGNRALSVPEVLDSMTCGSSPLFGVPILMGWDGLRPLSCLEEVGLDLAAAEARVRVQACQRAPAMLGGSPGGAWLPSPRLCARAWKAVSFTH